MNKSTLRTLRKTFAPFAVKQKSSIYIHFPFCKSKCHYCNFFSETNSLVSHENYIELLIKEASYRADYLKDTIVTSIYLGGGTPSLFDPKLIAKLLSSLQNLFNISEEAEITIELNPDDITADYLQVLKSNTKINRASIGVQSFNDEELALINRRHSSEKAIKSIELVSKFFDNISFDLIYALPSQTMESLMKSLDIALSFNPKHISAYSLTLEKNTPIWNLIEQKKVVIPNEDKEVDFYFLIAENLRERGYEHYEISNYCLQGYKSKHNSAYWTGNIYLGLGAGAHSFDGKQRRWNLASMEAYLDLESGLNYFEIENISEIDAYNEYIMLGLRTKAGINLDYIKTKYGLKFYEKAKENLSKIPANQLNINTLNYSLTDLGMLFADKHSSDFFIN